ncbi:hypothetical protein [Gordonia bronchialis]|uniref:hypothetical protein n=1 Tax=Gordonia bronchialis TaxID=2054 RepID=UPI00226E9CAB|nr:hypothetical protein [Gordonia bronchialis]
MTVLAIIVPGMFFSPKAFETCFRKPIESGTSPDRRTAAQTGAGAVAGIGPPPRQDLPDVAHPRREKVLGHHHSRRP